MSTGFNVVGNHVIENNFFQTNIIVLIFIFRDISSYSRVQFSNEDENNTTCYGKK